MARKKKESDFVSNQIVKVEYDIGGKAKEVDLGLRNYATFEQRVSAIEDIKRMCFVDGEYFPSNEQLATKIALVRLYTNAYDVIDEKEIFEFIDKNDIIELLANYDIKIEGFMYEVSVEIEWEKQKIISDMGIGGVMKKINILLDKAEENFKDVNPEQLNEMLSAVKTLEAAPDKVTHAVIDFEKAKMVPVE